MKTKDWTIDDDQVWVEWLEEEGEEPVAVLNFAGDFLDKLGWQEDDVIDMEVVDSTLILKKVQTDG
jgi:hypothetical protein